MPGARHRPTDLHVSEPEGPIVGVRAMQDTLRGWLAETGLKLKPHSAQPPG
jgi:hypothetical protein